MPKYYSVVIGKGEAVIQHSICMESIQSTWT